MRDLRDRVEPALKIVCLILAALVAWQLVGIVRRWNPFHGVTVPELPALVAATNNPPPGAHGSAPPMLTAAAKGTNGPPQALSTNLPPPLATAGTGSVSRPLPPAKETNVVARMETNAPPPAVTTNLTAAGTNHPLAAVATNGAGPTLATAAGTNAPTPPAVGTSAARPAPPRSPMAMGFNPFPPPGRGAPDLPPAAQAQISRITDSEILGPVMHPLPMALLGIAGDVAFLRSASGQTGLVKEGDSLGDLKLLRIGVNRVLIEQNGQKQELMIFSGLGGESLLQTDSTNENAHP